MDTSRYLITGATGQLGCELTKALGNEALPKPHEAFDVTNYAHVREWLPTLRPTMVIHCAAYNSVIGAEDPTNRARCWDVNAVATDNLVKTCAQAGIPFMYISTNRVFGQNTSHRVPYQEDDIVGPIGTFAQSKAAGEHAILRLGQCMCPDYWRNGFRYWIVRTANLYERPWRSYRNLPSMMLDSHDSRRTLHVPNNVVTSFTYVPHLVKAIKYIIQHRREVVSGVYHVANNKSGSVFDFATELARHTKKKLEVAPVSSTDPLTPGYSALDTEKFSENTGGPVLPCWREALAEYAHELAKSR